MQKSITNRTSAPNQDLARTSLCKPLPDDIVHKYIYPFMFHYVLTRWNYSKEINLYSINRSMATDLLHPPYGRRLLPCILDTEGRYHPKRTFATIPRSNNTSEGFQDISFLQIANAVNLTAQQLRAHFGTTPESKFETITFLGIPDLSYNIIFYTAVKCGYKVLLPSPRNALATNISLMEQTRSSKVVYVQEMEALFKGLVASKPELSSLMIGSLDELLNADEAPVVPYQPNFDEAVDDPIVVLHSSGSTGLPKPVVMTHGTFAVMDNDRNFPTVLGRKNHDLTLFDFDGAESRIYEPFPPFHVGGFIYKIVLPLYTHTIPVFGPPLRPPSGALVADILKQQSVRGCILPPAVAEQLLHEPDGLDCFKQLDVFCYGGGPLSQTTGDTISSVTSVCQFYGGTEIGQVRQLVPQGGDWPYMEFHPNAKLDLRPSDDDAYEMIIFADEGFCGLNHNFPEVKEWQTKDLFKRHPTKKNLWRFSWAQRRHHCTFKRREALSRADGETIRRVTQYFRCSDYRPRAFSTCTTTRGQCS